jgi:hypothetical protein
MRGKSPSSEPSGKTISSLFGVKTCKSKIQFEQHFFFEPEKPQATHPFEIPRRRKKNPSPPGPHEMVSSFIVRNCMSASSFLVMW